MRKVLIDHVLVLALGMLIAITSLGIGFLTNGNYSYILAINLVLFCLAGIFKKHKFSKVNTLSFVLLISLPYWVYYATQLSATPKIVIFPLVNVLGIMIGIFVLKRLYIGQLLIFAAMVSILSFSFGNAISSWVSSKSVNYKAPNFKVQSLDGTIIDSRQLKGKVLVIDFWATWCAPCIAEFKELEKFQKVMRKNNTVELLVINEDDGGNKDKVIKFLEKRSFELPFYIDSNASVYGAFEADSYPALFVIDKNYNIRMVKKGFNSADNLSYSLLEMVNKLK